MLYCNYSCKMFSAKPQNVPPEQAKRDPFADLGILGAGLGGSSTAPTPQATPLVTPLVTPMVSPRASPAHTPHHVPTPARSPAHQPDYRLHLILF